MGKDGGSGGYYDGIKSEKPGYTKMMSDRKKKKGGEFMTLPKALKDVIEKAAEEMWIDRDDTLGIAQALYAHLLSLGTEGFDEATAHSAAHDQGDWSALTQPAFVRGARYQHSLMTAQIEALKAAIESWKQEELINIDATRAYQIQIETLESFNRIKSDENHELKIELSDLKAQNQKLVAALLKCRLPVEREMKRAVDENFGHVADDPCAIQAVDARDAIEEALKEQGSK